MIVLGAGSGGSSAAYYLRQYADMLDIPVDITVFERNSYMGGRSTTVNAFGNSSYPIELGASIFVKANHNLMDAAKTFGLKITGAGRNRPRESEEMIGIWDGERFVYTQTESLDWWNVAKLVWRYGVAPIRTYSLMKDTVDKFLKLYKPPIFPFSSLSSAAVELGLYKATAATGAEFLEANSISADFSRDIIQASTRVNYGQNLPLIHGLETMVCMATDGAVSVENGNWRIFAGMLGSSRAHVNLNTAVTSIQRNSNGTFTIYHVQDNDPPKQSLFDDVVISTPLQESEITISPPLDHIPDTIPYVTLYVTLFSSPHRLSPQFFNVGDAGVPETVLTTLPQGLDLGAREDGVGPSGFWSISTLAKVQAPAEHETGDAPQNHYVYKVFSPDRLTAKFLANLLGVDSPQGADDLSIGDLPKEDISWHYEKTWHSYPYLYPRQTFEPISLASNLWYTSGIESFISTMETSSLMGMNVAGLMAEDWYEKLMPGKSVEWSRWGKPGNTEL
jgi:prenylcysteine oxidase/farnesylcysteine lyase